MLAYMFYSRYADEYTEHELQTFEILAKQITIALKKFIFTKSLSMTDCYLKIF